MAQTYGNHVEKVTFDISAELKEQVMALAEELHMPFSHISNEAVVDYLRQRELDRWEEGVELALDDMAYMALSSELGADAGDMNVCL